MNERAKPTSGSEYARLSFEVGLFAGHADRHLGRSHFGPLCRAEKWDLTPAKLEAWRDEAGKMGVPDHRGDADAE